MFGAAVSKQRAEHAKHIRDKYKDKDRRRQKSDKTTKKIKKQRSVKKNDKRNQN